MSHLIPPSDTLTGLLLAAQEEDEEDTSRLILADYLDERDDPRGTKVRLECQLARLEPGDPGWYELQVQLRQWREQHQAAWLGSRFIDSNGQRGLVSLRLSATQLLSAKFARKLRAALEQGWVAKVRPACAFD